MKVIEHLNTASSPLLSFEIIPPARGQGIAKIVDTVELLSPYHPSWIDVTAHASNVEYIERPDGQIEKRKQRKRPGTMGICGVIQNRFKIDTVAHLLCTGFSKEETEDALIELHYLGVENVLALRGDGLSTRQRGVNARHGSNQYAGELVSQIAALGEGDYLADTDNSSKMDFCIGVAGYPEKHFEAPCLRQDVTYLKQKLAAGADYVTTQLFYDNRHYFNFVDQCRTQGIEAPIVPGLKILKSVTQLSTIPKTFHVDFPDELVQEVLATPERVVDIGIEHATKQAIELLERNAPCIHFYVMNDAHSVLRIADTLRKLM